MNTSSHHSGAQGATRAFSDRARADRVDRAISLPLIRLFYPDADPTEKYPGETAEIEGFLVAPDKSITIAATWKTAGNLDMLDSVWDTFRRKGVGVRRLLLLDDRGRTVSIMTLKPGFPEDVLRLLRSILVVPIRASNGFAEIHFYATPGEFNSLKERIEGDEGPLPAPEIVNLPAARDTGILDAEDWAFLGLLSCVGAFDLEGGPSLELVAQLIGLAPATFTDRTVALERGLGSMVTELFQPSGEGSVSVEAA